MHNFHKIISLFLLLLFLNSCEAFKYKRSDVKDNPVNAGERVEKNILEGKGVRFGKVFNKEGGGVFDFASSNELWRATVDILDFVPLTNASYSGGIIITDWFNGGDNDSNRNLKITVKFLSNEIRSDAIKVDVHEKICNSQNNCTTTLVKSKISNEIKVAILKKAAFFEKNKLTGTVKENKKERPAQNINN
tara:strand:+ start:193 stop:765 length:573 start_codon:yes stop_codon:yes gene_type:complete